MAAHVPVAEAPTVQAALTALRRVLAQDLEPDPTTGQRRIRRGVAADRMPVAGRPRDAPRAQNADEAVHRLQTPRHETRRRRSDRRGRRAARQRARAPGAGPAWSPTVVQHGPLAEVQIDRGYLGSPRVGALAAQGVAIRAKAWTSTNRGRFPKQAFTIDLAAAQVVCPAQQVVADPASARPRSTFPPPVCQPVPAARGVHDRDPRRTLDRDPSAGSVPANACGRTNSEPDGPRAPPRTDHRRALARPRRPDPRAQGALQRRRARTRSTSDASPSSPISSGSPGSRRPRDFTCSAL